MDEIQKLQKIIKEQKHKIDSLEAEISRLFAFFSEMEVNIATSDLLKFTSSNSYFSDLVNEFVSKKRNNSKLMVASKLGMTQGRLYELINGTRSLTDDHLSKITTVLDLTLDQESKLRQLVLEDRIRKKDFKSIVQEKVDNQTSAKRSKMQRLKGDQKKDIDSWLHYAILTIFDIDGLIPTREWIADQLKTNQSTIDPVIDSLISMGHLNEKDGKLIYTFIESSMSNANSGDMKENFQKITLGQIDKAVEKYKEMNIPFENQTEASFGGFFFSGDKDKLKKGTRMLEESLVKIAKYMGDSKKDKLYSVSYQLTPLN